MIIKITHDKERAKSILQIVETRKRFLKDLKNIKTYSTIIAENYYEIIKELCVAIGLAEGYKAIGDKAHKEIIDFVKKYKRLDESEIEIMQDIRIRRNKSSYEGKPIEEIYLENIKTDLIVIIEKLEVILKNLLKS